MQRVSIAKKGEETEKMTRAWKDGISNRFDEQQEVVIHEFGPKSYIITSWSWSAFEMTNLIDATWADSYRYAVHFFSDPIWASQPIVSYTFYTGKATESPVRFSEWVRLLYPPRDTQCQFRLSTGAVRIIADY